MRRGGVSFCPARVPVRRVKRKRETDASRLRQPGRFVSPRGHVVGSDSAGDSRANGAGSTRKTVLATRRRASEVTASYSLGSGISTCSRRRLAGRGTGDAMICWVALHCATTGRAVIGWEQLHVPYSYFPLDWPQMQGRVFCPARARVG